MDVICHLPDAIGAAAQSIRSDVFTMRIKNRWEGLVSLMVGINTNKSRTNMFFIFGMLQLFHLNIFSVPSRGSGHGLGLQKCEARAVGPRKPCGGFIELGLTGLGLGWPAASRPGRHITNSG